MERKSSNSITMESRRKFSRFTAFTCVTVISCGLVLGGCGGEKKGKPEEEALKDTSILVETALPQIESIELNGDFIGTVEAEDEITVVVKVGGDVTATYFEEGDRVNQGDLLFTIDDTSARISMAQAQAGLESANASVASAGASVASANANVTLNELNLLYTQEQIKQSLGQVETNQMQLENAVASAKYALKAAQENEALAAEQFGLAMEAYQDLESNLDDLKDNTNNMKKYVSQLEKVRENYNRIKSASDADAANIAAGFGISVPSGVTDAKEIGEYYLSKVSGAATEYDLGVMINAAESQVNTLRSSRDSLDDSKDQVKFSGFQAAVSKETAKNNVYSAEDGLRLAEKMLEDYELYTKAVIIAGANYQLAGSNVGVISAQAGVQQAQAGVQQAQAGVKQAQAGVEAAQLQLDYTRVASPVSGTVTKKNLTVNNMATQGSPAYIISADDGIGITFYVSEQVMQSLTIGQEVQVERNGEIYTAEISENVGVADASNGLFKVKARLISGADKLIAGTSVKLTMATRKADNVMTIPVDSVYYESEKAYVYCMQNGKAVRTEIETGITNNENVEVKSGLTNDSRVITTWASQLKDGSDVKEKGGASDANTEKDSKKENEANTGGELKEDENSPEELEEASAEEVTDTQRLNDSVEKRILQGTVAQ